MDTSWLDHWQELLAEEKNATDTPLTRRETILIRKLRQCSHTTQDEVYEMVDKISRESIDSLLDALDNKKK